MEAELLRHIDNCRENHARLRLRLEITQERHIDLQHVELEILQIVERGIAAAEIVHPELEPLRAQAGDLLLEECIVLIERALRDLDVQELARHAMGAADDLHLLQHIVELKIDAREIHRDMRDIQPLPADALQILADALQHIEIEPVDEMRVLEHRHEHARRDEPPLGIAPARERLEAADAPRQRAHLRLVIHLDPALLDCLVEMCHEIRPEVQRLLHRGIEPGDIAIVHALDAVAGELRAVEDERDILDTCLRLIDAHLDDEREARLRLVDGRPRVLDLERDMRDARHHDEPVVVETRHRHRAEDITEHLRDMDEQLVPRLEAIALVDEAEILHIEIEECRSPHLDLLARLLHERRHRREPRELIAPFLAKSERQR